MSLSIFAKLAFRGKSGHLLRVSSIIRATQIAEATGAKLNPTDGYENDVCIYVKPHVKPGEKFQFEGKSYLDVIDGWGLRDLLHRHPEVTAIACSARDAITLGEAVKNKVITIPQHHCNFERERRTRQGITTIGVIGTAGAFPYLPRELKPELAKRGIDLIEFCDFYTRQDIIDFYKKVDVQIVWRPYSKRLANPLKLVNAASFGIPTIALDEPYFHELSGCYFPVRHLPGFLTRLDELIASPSLYAEFVGKCLAKAEEYHIANISKLYQDLS